MRTYVKSDPTDTAIKAVTVNDVIQTPRVREDGSTQYTWAVDAREELADGMTRLTVSSPRTGKHAGTVLFGADGTVKVGGIVTGEIAKPASKGKGKATAKNPAPVKVTRVSAPKGTETRKPRSAAMAKALATVDAALPIPASTRAADVATLLRTIADMLDK